MDLPDVPDAELDVYFEEVVKFILRVRFGHILAAAQNQLTTNSVDPFSVLHPNESLLRQPV